MVGALSFLWTICTGDHNEPVHYSLGAHELDGIVANCSLSWLPLEHLPYVVESASVDNRIRSDDPWADICRPLPSAPVVER
jgi:hypothetical protein